ncbi:MAG: ABC transporter permease, partial [Xanthomonadales bacterium]|nr:ABC transporter permease [Xanthomonadales bacterium]
MKNPIWTIFRKEVLENLRDRKTVINALILGPILGPLIMAIILSTVLTREQSRAEKPLDLPVVGAERAPNLVAFLATRNLKIEPAPKDPEAAIRDQDKEVVLRIGEDFGESWAEGKPAEVEMLFDSSRQDTGGATRRVEDALKAYGRQVSALRLVARGISPLITHPLAVVERDQASEVARGAMILMMLPYMLIMGAFMSGMYLAIDTTAGERERQSLEPLLATPVPRGQIM